MSTCYLLINNWNSFTRVSERRRREGKARETLLAYVHMSKRGIGGALSNMSKMTRLLYGDE